MFDRTAEEWQQICPNLTIDQQANVAPITFSDAELSLIADQFWETGYLNIAAKIELSELDQISSALTSLNYAKIP
ncbi:MAG: hypothetical protein JKY04_02310, partial [Sneathiella sp.]|nr:hypothetical protein [Sneathiella sp.]